MEREKWRQIEKKEKWMQRWIEKKENEKEKKMGKTKKRDCDIQKKVIETSRYR